MYYGWFIVAACFCLCFLFAGGGFYSFSIFINPIESEFGWNRADISLAMSIYLITGGLMGPVVGKLIEIYGTKRVMNFGAVGAGTCFILISQTHSIYYFYSIYSLLALSVSGIGIIPVSNLLSKWFDKQRGVAIGTAMVGISAGGLLLAPCVRYFNSLYGWKASFAGIGLLLWVVAIPLINLVIKERPVAAGAVLNKGMENTSKEEPSTIIKSYEIEGWPAEKALKSWPFWCVFFSFFLTPFAQMGVLQHQVPLIMDTGATEKMAAYVLGATAGIGGLGKLSFGRISEVWPFRYTILLCFGLQAAAVLVLLFANTPVMAWSYAILFGFAMGGVVVLLPLSVGYFWGLLSYGVLLGVMWIANCLGGALGTYTSGVIYDYLGDYQYALYLYVAFYLISIVLFFLAGRPRTYKSENVRPKIEELHQTRGLKYL